MPRATLPSCVKNLQTMTVLLTKTTEEMIWNHIEKVIEGWDEKHYKYRRLLDDTTQMYFDPKANPFDRYSVEDWRHNRPKLRYKNAKYSWVNEEDEAEFNLLGDIRSDVMKCVRAFPEWEERLLQTIYEMDKSNLKDGVEELVRFEQARYNESRKRYEEQDAEYIRQREIRFDHSQFHQSREQFYKDDYLRRVFYDNKEPEYWKTCEWCIAHEQTVRDQKEYLAEEQRLIDEDERKHKEQQRQLRQQELDDREHYECDLCGFSSYSPDAYDRHLDSREHKVNTNHSNWFCKDCEHHSRSKLEHEFHLATNKHKKKTGQLEVADKYECECCEYSTLRKDLYKKHLTTKAHLAKQKGEKGGEIGEKLVET